jgi:hypothetical protein
VEREYAAYNVGAFMKENPKLKPKQLVLIGEKSALPRLVGEMHRELFPSTMAHNLRLEAGVHG